MANCNCEVSSPIDREGGNEDSDRLFSSRGEARMSSILSCTKCGIVAISGESAHGFVSDIKSCSKVGSTYLTIIISSYRRVPILDEHNSTHFMNLSATPAPQGSFKRLSNVFPNITSSAEVGCRNRPNIITTQPSDKTSVRSTAMLGLTLNLDTPRDPFPIFSVKVLRVMLFARGIGETFDVDSDLAFEQFRRYVVRLSAIHFVCDTNKLIHRWPNPYPQTGVKHSCLVTRNGREVEKGAVHM